MKDRRGFLGTLLAGAMLTVSRWIPESTYGPKIIDTWFYDHLTGGMVLGPGVKSVELLKPGKWRFQCLPFTPTKDRYIEGISLGWGSQIIRKTRFAASVPVTKIDKLVVTLDYTIGGTNEQRNFLRAYDEYQRRRHAQLQVLSTVY